MKLIVFIALNIHVATCFAQPVPDYTKPRKFPTAEELMEKLNTYHSPGIDQVSEWNFSEKINVTPEIRKKLLSLLNREWTDQELTSIVRPRFLDRFEFGFLYQIKSAAYKITDSVFTSRRMQYENIYMHDTMEKPSKQFLFLYDSVFRAYYDSTERAFMENEKKEVANKPVWSELVLAAATANIREAIPIIEKDLKNPAHNIDPRISEAALAIFHVEPYLSRIINLYKDPKVYLNKTDGPGYWQPNLHIRKHEVLLLIGTQESIYEVSNYIDTTFKGPLNMRDPDSWVYDSYYITAVLAFLKNTDLIEGFKKLPFTLGDDYGYYPSKEQILFVRNWLLKNKGKYEWWGQ